MEVATVAAVEPPAASFVDRDRLAVALAAATQGAPHARVAVAVRSHGGTVAASVGGPDEAVSIGCIAKLLTATLVRAAVQAGRLSFDAELGEFLGPDARPLRFTTLRHLLEHTHGLDDSALDAPGRARGFVDAAELLRRAAALRRLASPGAFYSYGHLGAWLAAVALERVHGRRFSELARAWLEDALGLRMTASAAACPALGGGIALGAAGIARFAARAVAGPERWPSGGVQGTYGAITPLPGWNPLERGVFLGWKHAGRTWFGHQSAWPGASAYVRAQPATGLAIAIVARTHSAAVIAARLFGRALPELFDLRPPLEDAGHEETDWLGRYEQAALRARIARGSGGLELDVASRDAPALHARLATTRGAVRLVTPANDRVPFVQLVAVPGEPTAWLWNGRCLLRREGP